MHKIIKVRNLHCAACAAELQEELAAADGLSEVSVDFVTQRIALDYDAPASLARAIDMIVHFDKVEIIDGNAPVKGERHIKELISIVISALCFVPALVLHLLGGFEWVAFGLCLLCGGGLDGRRQRCAQSPARLPRRLSSLRPAG